jgi:outer membrane protein assembly factor BamB
MADGPSHNSSALWPRSRLALLAIACLFAAPLCAQETNWPQFRGPRGDGTSSATNLPLHWGTSQHLKWQTPIHGRGWSSPVIWGDQVWLSTATEDGRQLSAVCVERNTGRVERDLKLFDVAHPQYCHPFNSYASPTPVIEAGRLYATFGAAGTACVDTQSGKVLWTRQDIQCNHYRGAGSSPIICRNLLIVNFDGSDNQFIVALDKTTGQTVWRQNRSIDFKDLDPDGRPQSEGDLRKAFATCQMATLDGRETLLSQGSRALYAYNPMSGTELWRLEERTSYSGSTRPVTGLGLVFVPSGFSAGQLLALRPGKPGEVLDAKTNGPATMQLQVVWRAKRNVPKKPSLLLLDDLLYGLEDNGTLTCWEARTGTVVWSERLGGHFSASPLGAAGRIYCFSEEGKTTVVSSGREFHRLAENELGDGFMASPAVAGQALYLRSRTQLYRVEE